MFSASGGGKSLVDDYFSIKDRKVHANYEFTTWLRRCCTGMTESSKSSWIVMPGYTYPRLVGIVKFPGRNLTFRQTIRMRNIAVITKRL